ncbi:MAG: hypothetical protein DMG79_11105 [Acidobacteria bacterium]|nr:MAG: hypothetical protein DMG79_11105 [Acidobacteriota bacterium]
MISGWLASSVLVLSLAAFCGAYVHVSRHEGSYINILTPALVVNVPAFYLFPFAYDKLFGIEASTFAYVYVYATLATESLVFAFFYTRPRVRPIRLPFAYGYNNFWPLSLVSLALAGLLFIPLMLEFHEYIFEPRRIYELTRTGFGGSFYLSSTAAYLAVTLALFSAQSRLKKLFVVLAAALVLFLHGSKGQVLYLLLLVVLFEIYIQKRKVKIFPAVLAGLGMGAVLAGLFAATMVLGDPMESLETVSHYADYTRNAMLVIDSDLPRQYGRLTWEGNVLALVPRALMPDKPKNFGTFYLAEQFYQEWFDADTGSPAFGVGVQYADFGFLAIIYLAFFAAFRGWLAHMFIRRLKVTRHPGDFLVVAFLADIPLFPIGTGWLLPETIVLAIVLRLVSCVGAGQVYRERIQPARRLLTGSTMRPIDNTGSI